jgi:hypothetical protein
MMANNGIPRLAQLLIAGLDDVVAHSYLQHIVTLIELLVGKFEDPEGVLMSSNL